MTPTPPAIADGSARKRQPINRDTRAALACAFRIQGRRLETVALFGGFPSAAVEPGIYDRVAGRWTLRDDGGSVALQHRALSSGRLATPNRKTGVE